MSECRNDGRPQVKMLKFSYLNVLIVEMDYTPQHNKHVVVRKKDSVNWLIAWQKGVSGG